MAIQLLKSIDGVKIIIFSIVVAIGIHYFFVQPYRVNDAFMTPEYQAGDIILVDRRPYFTGIVYRDSAVVYRDAIHRHVKYLRRVIGLPFERVTVSDGILTIHGEKTIVKELPAFGSVVFATKSFGILDAHEYYVMSDINDNHIGRMDIRYIIGRPIIRIWPLNRLKIF